MLGKVDTSMNFKGLPDNYVPRLNAKETQLAIGYIRSFFEQNLSEALNLFKTESPLIMQPSTGMTETVDRESPRDPILFNIDNGGSPVDAEITQAATKWKRWALKQFDCEVDEGILTDMRAVRKDEIIDNYHSAYVDQWDWEKSISPENRTLEYLKQTVVEIWNVIKETHDMIIDKYPELNQSSHNLPQEIKFIHSEELLERYPNLSPDERENVIVKEYPAVFLIGVGYNLDNGMPHGTRTVDYDDWITETISASGKLCHGLNGDILVWNPVTQMRHELSSMAIRVTKETLIQQVQYSEDTSILQTEYGHMIQSDSISLSIGGGIGQSRLFMFLLQKAALGECSVSVWPKDFEKVCSARGIKLLR